LLNFGHNSSTRINVFSSKAPATKNSQQKGKSNNKGSFQKSKPASQPSSGNLGNGKFCGYCKILNHT
jgi:hypothetical protein